MGFWNGFKDGIVGAADGTWEGVKSLATGGYAIATDSAAREQAWQATKSATNAVANYAGTAYHDPAKALRDARDSILAAHTAAENFVETASAEDWGKLVGAGTFEIGTALIPGGALTRASKFGKLTKAGDALGDAAKALDRAEDIADAVDDAADSARAIERQKPGCVTTCQVTTQTVKRGLNEATWKVDAQGRPVSVEAHLKETAGTGARSSAELKAQTTAGKVGLDSDEGGHLIGHRFMDDQGAKNLFPQNANLNRSAYKSMENEWADWLASGKEIKLKIDLDPPGATRPDKIIAQYDVIDPSTGDAVFSRTHDFANQAGEIFERVPKSEMRAH